MSMPKYELYYFNARGRAEHLRLLFHIAGEKFEDVRVDESSWNKLKPHTPFGQLPYMEYFYGCGYVSLAQSNSIGRFLAKKFGLGGKFEVEQCQCDMYVDQLTDLMNSFYEALFHKKSDKKKKLFKKFKEETLPFNLGIFENRLASNKGFLVSDELTWADIYLFSSLDIINSTINNVYDNFPKLKLLDENLRNHPRLVEYLKNRSKTSY